MELNTVVKSAKRPKKKRNKIRIKVVLKIVTGTVLIACTVVLAYIYMWGLVQIAPSQTVRNVFTYEDSVYFLTDDESLYICGKTLSGNDHSYGFKMPLYDHIYDTSLFLKKKPILVQEHVSYVAYDSYGGVFIETDSTLSAFTTYVKGHVGVQQITSDVVSAAICENMVYYVTMAGELCAYNLDGGSDTVICDGFTEVKSTSKGVIAALSEKKELCVFPKDGVYDRFMDCKIADDVKDYSVYERGMAYVTDNGSAWLVKNVINGGVPTQLCSYAKLICIGMGSNNSTFVLNDSNEIVVFSADGSDKTLQNFGLHKVDKITAGNLSFSVLSDNTLTSWGINKNGQFGVRGAKSMGLDEGSGVVVDLKDFTYLEKIETCTETPAVYTTIKPETTPKPTRHNSVMPTPTASPN